MLPSDKKYFRGPRGVFSKAFIRKHQGLVLFQRHNPKSFVFHYKSYTSVTNHGLMQNSILNMALRLMKLLSNGIKDQAI